jgi:hypothetical protein
MGSTMIAKRKGWKVLGPESGPFNFLCEGKFSFLSDCIVCQGNSGGPVTETGALIQ